MIFLFLRLYMHVHSIFKRPLFLYLTYELVQIQGINYKVFPGAVSSKLGNSKTHKFKQNMFFSKSVKIRNRNLKSSFEILYLLQRATMLERVPPSN